MCIRDRCSYNNSSFLCKSHGWSWRQVSGRGGVQSPQSNHGLATAPRRDEPLGGDLGGARHGHGHPRLLQLLRPLNLGHLEGDKSTATEYRARSIELRAFNVRLHSTHRIGHLSKTLFPANISAASTEIQSIEQRRGKRRLNSAAHDALHHRRRLFPVASQPPRADYVRPVAAWPPRPTHLSVSRALFSYVRFTSAMFVDIVRSLACFAAVFLRGTQRSRVISLERVRVLSISAGENYTTTYMYSGSTSVGWLVGV